MDFSLNIVPIDYSELAEQLRPAWSALTSASENWEPLRPETGQCAVTALLVQELHGGVLRRALVNGESHYWNLIDGQEVDFTRAQFTLPLTIEDISLRERSYVLSFPATAARYNLLRTRYGL